MMRRAGIGLVFVLGLAGCSAHNDGGTVAALDAGVLADLGAPPLCTPGAQVACACPGGAASVQVCAANGTLGACACVDAGPADVGFAPCQFSNECGTGNVCADACCRPATDPAAACQAPEPFCSSNSDCASGSTCLRSICRVPCQRPGEADPACARVAVQYGYCLQDANGHAYCATENEAHPQCARSADCPSGRVCVDALCQ